MKLILLICRILVGSLFIVSGLIKVNDVLGFSYKLEEYFQERALGMPGLIEYVLPLAIFIVISEVLLGVALLLGAWPKFTTTMIFLLTVFFTWLTAYTWNCLVNEQDTVKTFVAADGTSYQDKPYCVERCGCFGDAIKLEPKESFFKDIIILVLTLPLLVAAWRKKILLNTAKEDWIILIVSTLAVALLSLLVLDWAFPIVFTLVATGAGILIKRLTGGKIWAVAVGVLVICSLTQYQTLVHLPIKDYRPYAIGNNIRELMLTADQVGKKPPQYMVYYTLKNKNNGEMMELDKDKYMALWSDSTFDMKSYELMKDMTRSVKISEGYEPKIVDFNPVNEDGLEMKDSLMALPKVFWVVSSKLDEADPSHLEAIRTFTDKAQADGIPVFGFSNVDYDVVDEFRHAHQWAFPFLQNDGTELKIIIRSNPGLLYLENGVMVNMWASSDIPVYEEAKADQFKD